MTGRWKGAGCPHLLSLVALALVSSVGALIAFDAVWAVGAAVMACLLIVASVRTPGRFRLHSRHVALVWVLAFSSLLPVAVAAPADALLAAWILGEWLGGGRRAGANVVLMVSVTVGFWILLSLHPNVPSLKVGFLGVYKSVFPLLGLVLGLAVERERLHSLVGHVIASLTVVLTLSILVHEYFPAWEVAMSRSAGVDTALYNNEARLQGVLPGPFHVAMGAAITILWGIQAWGKRRWNSFAVLVVAFPAIFLSYVRTSYLALAIAAPMLLVRNRDDPRRFARLAVVALAGGLLVLVAGRTSDQAEVLLKSLTQPVSDQRLLNRGAYYEQGIDMVARSPLFGWGAGSAGDTLESSFVSGEHVNSHNLLLKIVVEGGLIGAFLWLLLIVAILRLLKDGGALGSLASGVLVVLGVFGLTGSAIEAMPVTFLALTIVGAACAAHRVDAEATMVAGPSDRRETGLDR